MDGMDPSSRTTNQPSKPPRRLIDNAAEVRRRKEAAERAIKERHEALRRQHEEKIMKINEERQRQQRELKERHARELKRQQDVLQRRMALMERDNARKKEILEKNHAAVSRLSNNSSRKNYAFGSSTPRELSFLETRHLKHSPQEKRSTPDKQGSPNGAENVRRGRSAASVMSASMYVPSSRPDRSIQTASISRLAQLKSSPVKQQNLMTQSVYSPSANACMTPVTRLRRKPLNQLTSSVPNTPLSGSSQSTQNKPKSTPKPRVPPNVHGNSKRRTIKNEALKGASVSRRRDSSMSNETQSSASAITTESPFIDGSSLPDTTSVETLETESHTNVEAVEEVGQQESAIRVEDDVQHKPTDAAELVAATEETDIDASHEVEVESEAQESSEQEAILYQEVHNNYEEHSSDVEQVVSVAKVDYATTVISESEHSKVGENIGGVASLAEELASVFGPPVSLSATVTEESTESVVLPPSHTNETTGGPDRKEEMEVNFTSEEETGSLSVEKKAEDATTEEKPVEDPITYQGEAHDESEVFSSAKEDVNASTTVIADRSAHSNGFEKPTSAPVISAELPGTVPVTKEVDHSITKKPPSPPNEFIAHRLRREQEQRELDERKARIAAILAKSRDLSSASTIVSTGRTSPPRSEKAQDVLKRLASNGSIPALQKLMARHATESNTIEQFSAPEDPAPQAI